MYIFLLHTLNMLLFVIIDLDLTHVYDLTLSKVLEKRNRPEKGTEFSLEPFQTLIQQAPFSAKSVMANYL